MKFPRGLLIPALTLMVAAVIPGPSAAFAEPVLVQPLGFGQEGGWEVPPGEFNEIQRRGFHDGVEGAKRDFGNHRNPDVNNREEYRDPHVEGELREAYRDAFRRGYQVAASHLWGAPPPPPPSMQQPERRDGDRRDGDRRDGDRRDYDGWGMRGLASDAERQGYHEGSEEARKDFQFQRRPDPDDHEEYRSPRVPPELVDEYREGFMRGYEVTRSQLAGEPSWEGRGDPDRWEAPQQFSEIQRRGFREGIDGAKKDFGNHRRPNVANREEYREPRMPEEMWHEYREGFRRGYEMTANRLWGGM
jgi:hypothetical protein